MIWTSLSMWVTGYTNTCPSGRERMIVLFSHPTMVACWRACCLLPVLRAALSLFSVKMTHLFVRKDGVQVGDGGRRDVTNGPSQE